jgi:hypothetical protein
MLNVTFCSTYTVFITDSTDRGLGKNATDKESARIV